MLRLSQPFLLVKSRDKLLQKETHISPGPGAPPNIEEEEKETSLIHRQYKLDATNCGHGVSSCGFNKYMQYRI